MNRHMHLIALALVVAMGWPALAQPAPADQTAATQPDDDTAALRQEIEQEMKDLPVETVQSIHDVFHIEMDEGHLQLRTTLPPGDQTRRLVIDDLPGINTVMIRDAGEDRGEGEAYVPRQLSFSHYDFDDPTSALVLTEVSLTPMSLNITRGQESQGSSTRVQLIESGMYLQRGPETVRLYIQETTPQGEPTGQTLAAEDFDVLRSRYPVEVAHYLAPIFRDLKLPSELLSINDATAWQVLGDQFQASDDLKAKVEDLLVQLDADEPQVRRDAYAALQKIGQPAALLLMHRPTESLTPEQRNQVQTFLAEYRILDPEQAAAMRADPQFLIQALASADEALRRAALEELQKQSDQPIPFDPTAPPEQRLQQIQALQERFRPTTQPASEAQDE